MLRLAPSVTVLLLVLAGCTTTGYQRAATTAEKTESYHELLERLRAQVGLASDALRALNENPGDSPRSNQETYQTFALELENLERLAARTRKQHGKVDARADAFFAGWTADTADLTSAELKQNAETRRKALAASYARLEQGQAALDAALTSHAGELEELRLYLANDLTAAGIAGVRRTIQAAFVNGALLQDQIEAQTTLARKAAEELEPLRKLAPELSPRGGR